MPEARLERTRHPQPTVPPCVRLGHEFQYFVDRDLNVCIRCHLTRDGHGGVFARGGQRMPEIRLNRG